MQRNSFGAKQTAAPSLVCDLGTIRAHDAAENAADLAFALLNVQNHYDLDQFEELQQDAMTALVACAPRQGAPWVDPC